VFALPASPVRIVINGAKAPSGRNALIGTRFKVVSGYNDTAEIALAMERGEVQASVTGRGPFGANRDYFKPIMG
jgi:hypothetical protein